jgi:hypothetical protein
MNAKAKTDAAALSHLIDEKELVSRYKEVLASGCTPEFAKSYVTEVARSMAVNEAAVMSSEKMVVSQLIDDLGLEG